MKTKMVSITSKGQITIPKEFRERHSLIRKARLIDDGETLRIESIQNPYEKIGSLKHLFDGKTSHEILEEHRQKDKDRERLLEGISESGKDSV